VKPILVRPSPFLHIGTVPVFVDSLDDEGTIARVGVLSVPTRSAPNTPAGILLRRLRRALRLNLEEAGAALGLSIVEISEIERGILVVSDREFLRACTLLCGVQERGAPFSRSTPLP